MYQLFQKRVLVKQLTVVFFPQMCCGASAVVPLRLCLSVNGIHSFRSPQWLFGRKECAASKLQKMRKWFAFEMIKDVSDTDVQFLVRLNVFITMTDYFLIMFRRSQSDELNSSNIKESYYFRMCFPVSHLIDKYPPCCRHHILSEVTRAMKAPALHHLPSSSLKHHDSPFYCLALIHCVAAKPGALF